MVRLHGDGLRRNTGHDGWWHPDQKAGERNCDGTDHRQGQRQLCRSLQCSGDEDHLGDMDFKVTGTKDRITACQMDIKISGLSYEILEKALMQARAGNCTFWTRCSRPSMLHGQITSRTLHMEVMRIPKEFIGAVIGPGGKVIQGIRRYRASISIEEEGEEGIVEISSNDGEAMASAVKAIKEIIFIPEVGQVYHGTVKNIMPFGAFVEIAKERMDCCIFRRSNTSADWKKSKMC